MFGDKHTWMGFLDPDEFLEMTGGETLSDFLHGWARNDTVGAVGVNWLVHSSAGLLTRPVDGPRKAFNRCISDDIRYVFSEFSFPLLYPPFEHRDVSWKYLIYVCSRGLLCPLREAKLTWES